jgi:hypothetical protein
LEKLTDWGVTFNDLFRIFIVRSYEPCGKQGWGYLEVGKQTVLSTKQVRTRLGGYVVDMKYMPDDIFLIEKKGEDDFVGCLCSVKFLEDHGVTIDAQVGDSEVVETESKPKSKKK